MSDEYRPRPDDHLVEPFFGAFGEPEADAAARVGRGRRCGWFWVGVVVGVVALGVWVLG